MSHTQTPSSEIHLSIAIVTRNRPVWLRKCLNSWRAQSIQPFEIVVSDDSTPEYDAEVEKIAAEFGCRYVKGPRRGLYANRNNAALSCQGSHIMSADDDHTHPPYFTESVLSDVMRAPECVWTYSEKHSLCPEEPLHPIPELMPDNRITTARDRTHCHGVSDGSTVYPHTIFDRGLRYDETYPFGALWYLWGQLLSRNGYRIQFSDKTFVWHDINSSLERSDDIAWVEQQIECNLYVLFRNAIHENKSPTGLARAMVQLFRVWLRPCPPTGVKIASRLPVRAIIRAVRNAIS
jgi:glycosyltransferase involved in cell wall biosynthesis